MSGTDELEALKQQVARLTRQVHALEDASAIRRVQFAYGYFMDKGLYQEVVDLFAADGEVRFMGGRNGPVYGLLLDHLQLQDIIDVAADGQSARGRFRALLQGGSHTTRTDAPPGIPQQWWEAGVYENEYVREEGVWRIKVLDYRLSWQADFDKGWAHSTPHPGPFFRKTYPADPHGPDELSAEPAPFWPDTAVVPFHFSHPVT